MTPIISSVGLLKKAINANPIVSIKAEITFVYERVTAITLPKKRPGNIMAKKKSEMLIPARCWLMWYFSKRKAVSKVMTRLTYVITK